MVDETTRQTILIVDDEQEELAALREALEESEFNVETAYHLREAEDKLKDLKDGGTSPAVVVLDVMIPAMSLLHYLEAGPEKLVASLKEDQWAGARFWSVVRRDYPRTSIVIYSAQPEAAIRDELPEIQGPFLRKGSDDLLTVYRTILKAARERKE